MSGFNVETYQISKKKNNASNETNYDDISNRVTTLENSLMSINSTFFCDFSEDDYIDKYKSTIINTSNGIIPRQQVNNTYINFRANDDYVDYDKSTNIAWDNKSFIQFDRDITTEGQLYLFPIKVNNAMGFKLDSDYKLTYNVSGVPEKEIINGSLWTAQGVDNYGRLWVFSKPGYTNLQTEKITLNIYNKDMSVYKTKVFDNFLFTANYIPRPESTIVKFNEENICFIGSVVGGTTGIIRLNATDGETVVEVYKKQYGVSNETMYCITPPRIYINSNIIMIVINSKEGYYSDLSLGEAIIKFNSLEDYKIIYKNENSTYNGSPYSTFQYRSNIFRINNCLYYFRPTWTWDYQNNSYPLSYIRLEKFDINNAKDKVDAKELTITCSANDSSVYTSNSLNGYFVHDNKFYNFYNNINSKTLIIRRYAMNIYSDKVEFIKEIEKSITLATTTIYDRSSRTSEPKFIIKNNELHVFYITRKSDTDLTQCIKYMTFDLNLNQGLKETILFETSSSKLYYDVVDFNDELTVIANYNKDNDYTNNDTNSISQLIKINKVSSRIKFYYLDNVKRIWTNINSGDEVNFESPVSEITIRAIMESDTYNCSPVISNITLESWNNENGVSRQSEYYSNRIENIQNNGRGILSADYEDNDGIIEWFISYDGGENYAPIKLNEEFNFSHIESPDFRVKAILSVTDNAKKLPIIHNYTIKTNYLVLHSDLEELQINLMKTNFKIDTYSNAAKNGLLKMTVDTLSNEDFIDGKNSKHVYYPSYGYAGGNYLQTKPEEVNKKVQTILLTVDEILENDDDHILYYASADGGKTFKEIKPYVKTQLKNTNKSKDSIVMKAVFYGGAKLNAWGWAWN